MQAKNIHKKCHFRTSGFCISVLALFVFLPSRNGAGKFTLEDPPVLEKY